MNGRLLVGRVTAVHGLRGECVVEVLSDAPQRFAAGSVLGAGDPEGETSPLTIRASRPHKARLLVQFAEVPDRTAAEHMRGTLLSIPVDEAAPLPDGTFYLHQLEGMAVFDESGASLGTLVDVLENPAHDIWVVRTSDERDVMVPAVAEFIRSVDADRKTIVLAPIEGMFE